MKNTFYLISIFFLFIACNQSEKKEHLIENSEVQKYLTEYIDLQEEKDIQYNPYSFKLLKALHEQETFFINEFVELNRKERNRKDLMDSIYHWLEIPVALKNLDDSITSAIEFRYWRPYTARHFISIIQSSKEHVWMESFFYELDGNPLTHPKTYNKTCLTIIEKDKRTLTEKEWNNFRTLFAHSEFWQLQKYHNQNIFDPHGTDWDFRGYSRGSQPIHEVSLSSPPKGNNFRDIGEFMIEKSQIDIGRIF